MYVAMRMIEGQEVALMRLPRVRQLGKKGLLAALEPEADQQS